MYLKRLELLGFKSFADKIKLEFMPGVTAVVGPNGSGKSNISDALRWVLGEQSIKNLRGSKMDDVIFAGTESRKQLGLAEVTMVLDNSDRSIPLDFTEVSVTRRLFRSGESEYLINKSQVRLKDIHELFYDTGLGKDAYSVISQGKIDAILSVKAEERRSIFEEAAGIIKYKSRKQVAERKLEDTDRNLTRVQDIINELQLQLGPLETQSRQAERFLALRERLSGLEINYYGKIIEKLLDELNQLQQQKQETEARFHDFESEENILDSELETIRLEVLNLDHQIAALNEEYFRIQNQVNRYQEQSRFLHTKLSDLDRQEQDYLRGSETNSKRRESLLQERSLLEAEIAAINQRLAGDQALLEAEEQKLNQAGDSLRALEQQEEQLKNEVFEILNRISGLRNKQSNALLQREFLAKQMEDCRKKQEYLRQQLQELNDERQEKNNQLEQVLSKLADIQTSRKERLEEGSRYQREIAALEDKIQEYRQRIRTLEGKIGLLEDMEKSYQGYFQGVKALLSDASGERFHGKIRGIVADLIKVRPGMELALETALGSSLQHVVIDDDQAAQDAIAYLKRKSKGRATFLPLNRVRAYEGRQVSADLLKQYDCHPAIALLDYQPEYHQVVQYLLNQVIVAPNLRTAIEISTKLDRGFRIVTPEGDLVNPGGSITGGSNDRQRVGLLSRRGEIDSLKNEKAEYEHALSDGMKQLQVLKQSLEENQSLIEQLKTTEVAVQSEQIRIERDLHMTGQNYQRISDEIRLLEEQLQELEEAGDEFNSGHENLDHALELEEQRLKEAETVIQQLSASIQSANQQKEAQFQRLSEVKSRLSAGLQELNGKEILKANLDRQLQEIEHSNAEMELKQAELVAERERIGRELVELEQQQMAGEMHLAEQQDLINAEKTNKENLHAKIRELEGKQRSFRRKNNEFQNQLRQLEIQITQKTNSIENYQQSLIEDYGLDWESQVDENWESPANVVGVIEDLKNEIRELGPVNLAAIEDYRQVKQRCEFLSTQAEDLRHAKSSLLKVIHEIERTIEKRFIETFEQIRIEFRKIFSELFEGGNADLFLVDSENVLESGIEIIAQPPGKKLQSLSLLSGGERAMTAIALLFSILSIKPAPFCILDEIDATLDEANVQRFAKLLEIFSKRLQFIVVTHRRGTMEVANTIYGVTMEEKGISKLISLSLEEVSMQTA
ncbi:MAG TPA: chromosome segregation protein SMC [Bacillota bacterium]|nr:chromosome segregation protein SMC [Bacillota bacterium]